MANVLTHIILNDEDDAVNAIIPRLEARSLRPRWYWYELISVRHHAARYGHMVWHNDVVPLEQLVLAGLITSQRVMDNALRRQGLGLIIVPDNGFDFLAREQLSDGTHVYHGGQCKNFGNRKVTPNDLGTFKLKMEYMRAYSAAPASKGYLYTTTGVTRDLKESQERLHWYTFNKLEFPSDAMRSLAAESELPMRDYQLEAITKVIGPGKKIINMFCAAGKGLIAGHVMRDVNTTYKLVIMIAPLRLSVDQLRTRMECFVGIGYASILVDTDGTSNKDVIRKAITAALSGAGRLIVYSTFKSAKDVISMMCVRVEDEDDEDDEEVEDESEEPLEDYVCFDRSSDDVYLVVDECHSLDDLTTRFCKPFCNSLFMSATIPADFYSDMGVSDDNVISVGIGFAIANRYICDYEIVVPYSVDGRLPQTIEDLANFLATGMLRKGAKRCIVYLANIQECTSFNDAITDVFHTVFASSVWTGVISCDVGRKQRDLLLKEFQSGEKHRFYIMSSVFILDQAINLPKADSVFIPRLSRHSKPMQTLQRMQRSARLDPDNPCKTNHVFVAAEDCAAMSSLVMVRDSDPDFHKKIRVMDSDFSKLTVEHMKEERAQEIVVTSVLASVMTEDSRFMKRLEDWAQFYEEHRRVPSRSSDNDIENSLAMWATRARMTYHDNGLTPSRVTLVNAVKGWCWSDFERKVKAYTKFVVANDRVPNKRAASRDEMGLAQWLANTRRRLNISEVELYQLTANPLIPFIIDRWKASLVSWASWYVRHGAIPKYGECKVMYNWQNKQIVAYKAGTLKPHRLQALKDTPGFPKFWESG